MLQAIATVAQGDTAQRDKIEEALAELKAQGWHLKTAVHHLWAGERNAAALTAGLDEQDALLYSGSSSFLPHRAIPAGTWTWNLRNSSRAHERTPYVLKDMRSRAAKRGTYA